jgi:hypothetical protein
MRYRPIPHHKISVPPTTIIMKEEEGEGEE